MLCDRLKNSVCGVHDSWRPQCLLVVSVAVLIGVLSGYAEVIVLSG